MGIRVRAVGALVLAVSVLGFAGASAQAESPADWMYEPTTFSEIKLTLPPASYEKLEDTSYEKNVEGFFSIAETNGTPGSAGAFSEPIKVGVKLKGSFGSRRNINEKAALKLKFDQYVPGQTFLGLAKMTLNNMIQDPSFIHEVLAYQAFRAMGVSAPHVGFAYLVVNGKSYGLHLNVETQDRVALEKTFGPFNPATQHLYEGEYEADVSSAAWHGGPEKRWEKLEVEEGEETKADLEALLAAVEGMGGTFSQRVANYADLPEMTRMWLVEKYIKHWDGYSVNPVNEYQPNNYYLYSDAAGRFKMLPWGTDQTWELARNVQFDGSGGALYEGCKGDPACWSLFKAAGNEALTKLNALDLGTTARCTTAAVLPWREYEDTAPEGKRAPQSVAQTKEEQQKTAETIAARPAELASFLEVTAPPKPTEKPACPPLRPIGGFPKPLIPVTVEIAAPPAPLPTPQPTTLRLGRRDTGAKAIQVEIEVSDSGKVSLLGTFATGSGRAVACRGARTVAVPGKRSFSCRLTAPLKTSLELHSVKMRLKATLAAPGGTDIESTTLRIPRR